MGLKKGTDLSDFENLRVGAHTFENFYTNEEMKEMEKYIEETEAKALKSKNIFGLMSF